MGSVGAPTTSRRQREEEVEQGEDMSVRSSSPPYRLEGQQQRSVLQGSGGPSLWLKEKDVLDGFVAAGLLTRREARPRLGALREAAREWMRDVGKDEPHSAEAAAAEAVAKPGAADGGEDGDEGEGENGDENGDASASADVGVDTDADAEVEVEVDVEVDVDAGESIAAHEPPGTLKSRSLSSKTASTASRRGSKAITRDKKSRALRDEVQLLLQAAEEGKWYKMRKLLESGKVDVNATDSRGRTALYLACENGNADVVTELCNMGTCDVNKADTDKENARMCGSTPLHRACEHNFPRIVRELLECPRVDVNRTNRRGDTPLLCAVANGNTNVLRALAAVQGIDPNKANVHGWTPLQMAWSQLRKDAVKVLLAIPGILTLESSQPAQGTPIILPGVALVNVPPLAKDAPTELPTVSAQNFVREQTLKAQAQVRQRLEEKTQELERQAKRTALADRADAMAGTEDAVSVAHPGRAPGGASAMPRGERDGTATVSDHVPAPSPHVDPPAQPRRTSQRGNENLDVT